MLQSRITASILLLLINSEKYIFTPRKTKDTPPTKIHRNTKNKNTWLERKNQQREKPTQKGQENAKKGNNHRHQDKSQHNNQTKIIREDQNKKQNRLSLIGKRIV